MWFGIDKSLVEIYKAILKLNKGSSFGTRQSTRRRTTRSERSDNYLPIRWRFWHNVPVLGIASACQCGRETCLDSFSQSLSNCPKHPNAGIEQGRRRDLYFIWLGLIPRSRQFFRIISLLYLNFTCHLICVISNMQWSVKAI